jgi:hypothetical protein
MNLKYMAMVTTAAGLLLTQRAPAQDAKSVIDNAQKAMGTPKTVEYSGSGADFVLGQAFNPSSPWPRFNDKTYTRAILSNRRRYAELKKFLNQAIELNTPIDTSL